MPFIFPVGVEDTGYKIERSLRLRAGVSPSLTRSIGVSGNRKTFTFHTWIKRGALDANRIIWAARSGGAGNEFAVFYLNSSGQFVISARNSSGVMICSYTTVAVYRDPSAWMDICLGIDSTTQSIKLEVNGVDQALTQTTQVGLNADFAWFSSTITTQYLFDNTPTAESYFDGYVAEMHLIDGQKLSASDFGEFDAITGVWMPKEYKGSYGTQSSYLKFTDNSAATASAIGKDYSGNGNNWTPSGVSVTAGATNDSLVDSPTNYGADTGLGGQARSNYCTLNPLDNAVALSGSNLTINGAGSGWNGARGTQAVDAAKDTYWEIVCGTAGTGHIIGISSIDETRPTYPGFSAKSYGYQQSALKHNSSGSSAYGATYTSGDVIGVRLNAGVLTFYKNGVSQGDAFTGLNGLFFPQVSLYPDAQSSVNFGQRAFSYAAPSGSKCLCTQNLSDPAIKKPSNHFDVNLRAGTGAAANVTGKLSPDLVWIKNRAAGSHHIFDSIRGPGFTIATSDSNAQLTRADCFTAFNSDGYSLGTGASGNTNTAANSYVDWFWKAGGAAVANGDGTISAQVSANPLAGFSVVKWTGIGANGTIGHGLNAVPKLIIVKRFDTAQSWAVWNKTVADSSAARIVFMNTTDAWGSYADVFNSGAPDSSVFPVGTGVATNAAGGLYIAYVFADVSGYSKFGSYVGNGNANGPFVWLGFRPRWIMFKRVDSTSNWLILDTARNPSNEAALSLYPNLSIAEDMGNQSDFLSNGFKPRNSAGSISNISGATFIYAAFAEHPFKYARAR